jgi:hypothetical protein
MFLLVSCQIINQRYESTDTFYRAYGDFDSVRFPLIKPFEVIKSDDKYGWLIELNDADNYYMGSIINIHKISISQGLIFIYSKSDQPEGVINKDSAKLFRWFVINPDQSSTIGFKTDYEFNEYVNDLGINEIVWYLPDDVYDEFEKTGCLYWIPDCQIPSIKNE